MEVLLVACPFVRLAGSHNDRVPLELAYLQAYLRAAGLSTGLLNADATGASVYCSWQKLFANSHHVAAAARGDSPLLSETIERILSYEPAVVVLATADGVTPWVDTGNPYVAALISAELRASGAFTVGVGPFLNEEGEQFVDAFDAVVTGVASPSIVPVVTQRSRGVVHGAPHDVDVLPDLETLGPGGRGDVVMTAFGCPMSCSFCFARTMPYRPVSIERVVEDVRRRSDHQLDFGDAILPLGVRRLEELGRHLTPLGRRFTCEVSVRTATDERLQLLTEMGVRGVKLGVESGSNRRLQAWGKHQTFQDSMSAAAAVKRAGLHLTAYVLLGGADATLEDAEVTLELCQQLAADDYVINVAAYADRSTRHFGHESHFSWALVEEYGLTNIIDRFFELQAPEKAGLGKLVA